MYIDWGAEHLAWCQHADRHDKSIIEINRRWADSNEAGDDSAEPSFISLDDGLAGFGEEGKKIYKLSCLRERVEGNRLNILQIKGYECEVCRYQFSKQYVGFKSHAVVHHKKPLALGTRKSANVDDFAVLCAPCHVAAHMGEGRLLNPWTIEELKAKIKGMVDGSARGITSSICKKLPSRRRRDDVNAAHSPSLWFSFNLDPCAL